MLSTLVVSRRADTQNRKLKSEMEMWIKKKMETIMVKVWIVN